MSSEDIDMQARTHTQIQTQTHAWTHTHEPGHTHLCQAQKEIPGAHDLGSADWAEIT